MVEYKEVEYSWRKAQEENKTLQAEVERLRAIFIDIYLVHTDPDAVMSLVNEAIPGRVKAFEKSLAGGRVMPDTTCSKCGARWGGVDYASLVCPSCEHDAEVDRLQTERDAAVANNIKMQDCWTEVERLREKLNIARATARHLLQDLKDKRDLDSRAYDDYVTCHPWLEDE